MNGSHLPRKNRRLIHVARHEGLDIVLVRCDDIRIRVECVVRATRVKLADVHIHSAVVRPVVRQRDNEPDAVRLRGRYDGVEARDSEVTSVERRFGSPPLSHDSTRG